MFASGVGLALPAWAGSRIASGQAFGGHWRLITADKQAAQRAVPIVETVVDDVTRRLSPYLPDSEVSRFNAAQDRDWQEMSEPACRVVREALRIARLSAGAFDPTVGPAVSRYGFGPIIGASGRYDDIVVAKGAICKKAPGLTLDLCGIAKGYALDRISAGLTHSGIDDAMIEIGGEVRALGRHPDGRAWKIGIEDPLSEGSALHCIVTPGALSLATSGHAANGLRKPAKTSHIIDPGTDRPARMSVASVSVLAPTGMEADAMATALCARGARVGIALAQKLGVPALFLTDESEAPAEVVTGGFEAHIVS
jgi:thiamine biosynthesis lipoprotein